MNPSTTQIVYKNKILILGFGCIGQAVLPLLFQSFKLDPSQIVILSKHNIGADVAKNYGVQFKELAVTENNYLKLLPSILGPGDFLLNLSVGVSSIDLIKYCQTNKILYLDAGAECWEERYRNDNSKLPSNYALRDATLQLKQKGPTAVLRHGANPGLVSHFLKQALWNVAKDNNWKGELPRDAVEWAQLAHDLNIKTIHISEHDTQISAQAKKEDEFINTWSVDALIFEALRPAELGWGSHERHLPHDANHHGFGSNCGIYLSQPGAETRVRTWTPASGAFNGFLITHNESLSIADYLTLKQDGKVMYRPTVHYAYHPCPDAVLSLKELVKRKYIPQKDKRIMLNEIVDGTDELGVLLMGNKKGAYWYGSHLSIHEAKKLANHNSATSLQVAAGVLAGMIWAIKNPERGIIESEDMDHEYILSLALPYLGKVGGYYTDWNPLQDKKDSKEKHIDHSDPWQFINIRVSEPE
ncbi:saccharopine dehydrogenase C-terminal domain-containing protein [Legionella shakespearei]|uniref:Homospermidine synthase n=1 Tax=Legionella shakespearei DSM 23087 TaxID=1122169 RepID=A0A0W0YLP7_9GAMM|nr:saccharopine dehydrogenase C-terminal domain-containing protein [Legionella shakespearei]KTD57818.1 homospermidine synthase [Legionella shakespearei DSM 23087]